MRLSRFTLASVAVATAAAALAYWAATPPPASARIIPEGACKAIGDLNGFGGKACDALSDPGRLLKTGKSLVSGHIGSAIKDLLGSGAGSSASAALGLAAVVAWIVDGARTAVHDMGKVINETAAPNLGSVWFSSTYWRIAAVSALLTLPFLFAAALQALMRSDLSLLARAAFSHLPIALVGVGVAAPMTMLLLSGTDELCSLVWSPSASNGLTSLFAGGGTVIGAVALAGSPFLALLLCLFTAAAGMLVWLELAMREAAVYIVVLMLPLAFAALVWPARRVWAVRAVEVLVALILSKFAIVAVLGLGGAALDQAGAHGLSAMLAGMVLVLLAALAPWAVLRLVPLTEVASSAAGALRPHAFGSLQTAWPSNRTAAKAEGAIAGVASNIADLVRLSPDGHAASPKVAASSNGHSGTRASKTDRPAFNWEHDALHTAAQPEEGAEDKHSANAGGAGARDRAGFAIESDRAGLASDASGTGLGADTDGTGFATEAGATDFAHQIENPPAGGGRESPPTEERVPGAGPLWQAPDMSWHPLPLGLDEGWPPDPPWPAQATAAGPSEDVRIQATGASPGGAPTPDSIPMWDPAPTPPDSIPTPNPAPTPPDSIPTPRAIPMRGATSSAGSGAEPGVADETRAGTRPAAEQSDPLPPTQDRGGPLVAPNDP